MPFRRFQSRIIVVFMGLFLLVLAAMNLCSQHIKMQKRHQEELNRYQEQVSATVEVISKTINQV